MSITPRSCSGATCSSALATRRSTLDVIARAEDYLPTVSKQLDALADDPFDLLICNAGMDPHEDSAIGGLAGITTAVIAERERLVFGWARRHRVGVAFTLAGGYTGARLDQARLVDLHRLTIQAAATPSANLADGLR